MTTDPGLPIKKPPKSFKKDVTRFCAVIEASGVKHQELLLETPSRELWAALYFEREDAPDNNGRAFERDFVRVNVFGLTRNPAEMWVRPMSIVITAHTIDRVIQRAGIVDLPIQSSDITAIDVQLAEILVWARASFFVLGELPLEQGPEQTIVLPGQYGFFLGSVGTNPTELNTGPD